MSIFSRLFNARPKPSSLEAFLSKLTPITISSALLRDRDNEMRVASGISFLVFTVTQRFASDLLDSSKKFSQIAGTKTMPAVAFDVIVFESAGFLYYTLLKPVLKNSVDESADDPYLAVLLSSAHLSAAILRRFTDFDLPENFFIKRVISYIPSDSSNATTKFETILNCAIEGGSPKSGLGGLLSLTFGVELPLKTLIPAFCALSVPLLSVSARQMFEKADELGLADYA